MKDVSSKRSKTGHPGESALDSDGDSERAILEEDGRKNPGIMKTTRVTVVEEGGASRSKDSQISPSQFQQGQV